MAKKTKSIKQLVLKGAEIRCKIKNDLNGYARIGAYLVDKKSCLLFVFWNKLL